MSSSLFAMYIASKLLHPSLILLPTLFAFACISIIFKLLHPLNALAPICTSFSNTTVPFISISCNPFKSSNISISALSNTLTFTLLLLFPPKLICLTSSSYGSIVTLLIPVHPLNASFPICIKPFGNINSPIKLLQSLNAVYPIALNFVFNSKSIVKLLHPLKASFPIATKSSGNSTSSNAAHPLNAAFDIKFNPSGNTIVFRFVQFSNALFPIFITLSGNITFFTFVCPLNASSAKLISINPSILSGTSNVSGKSPDIYFSALALAFSYVYCHVISFSSVI